MRGWGRGWECGQGDGQAMPQGHLANQLLSPPSHPPCPHSVLYISCTAMIMVSFFPMGNEGACTRIGKAKAQWIHCQCGLEWALHG